MKPAIFHSIPEALVYALLILMLALNVIALAESANNANQARLLAAQNQRLAAASQSNTVKILQSQQCIASFFLIPGTSRSTSSLNSLAAQPACAATIKSIQ